MKVKTKTKTKMKTNMKTNTKIKNKTKTKIKMNFRFYFHFAFHFIFIQFLFSILLLLFHFRFRFCFRFCFCFFTFVFVFIFVFVNSTWPRSAMDGQLSLTWPRSATVFSLANFTRGLAVQILHVAYHLWSISLGIKFHLKQIILIFWTKSVQKGYFRSKTEKVNSISEFCLFHLDQLPNFNLTENFDFFDQICPKRVLPV